VTFQDSSPGYIGVVRPKGIEAPPPDPWGDFKPIGPPIGAAESQGAASQDDPWADFKPVADNGQAQPPANPPRQVGTGEALAAGAAQGATFGALPAIAGATAAGEAQTPKDLQSVQDQADAMEPSGFLGRALTGAFKAWQGDPVAKDAYDRGREAALADQNLVKEQKPVAFLFGQLAGTLAMPLPGAGAMRAGTIGARALGGAKAGAAGGALYGGGEALGEGKSATDIAKGAGIGAAIGAPLGAGIGAVAGPRARAAMTPGEQAARTAEIIGAPIPKGLASDSRAVQGATSSAASVPLLGPRITGALDRNAEAAGNVVGGSGAQDAITANRARIDALYNGVRSRINPDATMPMPRTDAAVQRVIANRRAARNPHPAQGLEQFEAVGRQGASFNGAHRARVDAREAGNALVPHPGYNAADYNGITRAMTADIRAGVNAQGGRRALNAFDEAERNFGPISQANAFLNKLTRHDPAATLEALGYNPATDHFSLDKFVTAMNKIKPESRPFVPSPGHRAAIEAVFQMGTHLKGAMRGRNTSHTSNAMILFDIAKTAGEVGIGVATGVLSGAGVVGGAAGAAPALIFMHWLSSPSIASSMGAWSRAYRVATLGVPTPARIAAFNVATRNLSANLGVPAEDIMRAAQRRLAAPANDENQNQQ
jgi:hypothetical protein